MDKEVERDHHPLHSRTIHQLTPRHHQSGRMMVRMKEPNGFMLERQENGIQQLVVFQQMINVINKRQSPCAKMK